MLQITISEYGYIGCDNISTINDKFVGNRDLTPTLFQELYDFWLSDEESQKVLTFVNKKCLKAKNYVGVIQTANITIEILPKIYDGQKEKESRDIFIKMLKPLLNINEIQLNRADLSTTKNRNIYEIFITMFIEYVDKLIHKGIKSQYLEKEENQHFLKGKLQFNQHIKKNYIHKERFYVQFDEYLPNRAENRVIKSTISLLLTKTKDHNNRKSLRQQLFIFDEVNLSTNYETDIKRVNLHRGMEYYDMPIRFAKLFLTHNSFSSLRGKENVFALLFPMQTVFEKYMEFVLENSKEKLGIQQVLINGGRDEYFLSNGACKMTNLNPDYLLKMKSGKDIITDAKWKILEEKDDTNKKCNKVSITSNDVYQIFAYLNFYDCRDTAYLFVPKIENEIVLNYNMTNKKIKIIPIDLVNLVKNHKAQKEWFVDGHNEVL